MCIFEVFFEDQKIDGEVINTASISVLTAHTVQFTPSKGSGTMTFELHCPVIGATVERDVMDGQIVLDMVVLRADDQEGCD